YRFTTEVHAVATLRGDNDRPRAINGGLAGPEIQLCRRRRSGCRRPVPFAPGNWRRRAPDLSCATVARRILQCELGRAGAVAAKVEWLPGLQINEQYRGGRMDTELNERNNVLRAMAADR